MPDDAKTTDLPDKITAPWSDEHVAALNAYQLAGSFHPYTCGRRSSHGGGALTATRDGWVCPDCTYTQRWAWRPQ